MHLSLARWIVPVSCIALLVPVLASARVSDASTGLSASGRAAGLSTACSGSATQCIATLLGRVLNILFGFLGIVLLGYVLYGGFVWMTASSSKDVDQAKSIMINAVIGCLIIVCSFAISNFVLGRLGEIAGIGSGTSNSAGSSGSGSSGSATVDQLRDGQARPCCYGNPNPMLSCLTDCQRNPAAFGVTAPATEASCTTPCGSRLCVGGSPSDPRPVAGQLQCTPGSPTERPAGNQTSACQTFDATPPPVERCALCVNQCQRNTICNANPNNNVGSRPREQATAAELTAQAGHCRTTCVGSGACTQ